MAKPTVSSSPHDPSHYSAATVFPVQGFALGVVPTPHPTDVALHTHDFVEIVYVTHGSARHHLVAADLDGKRDEGFSVIAGDVFAVPLGVHHGYTHTECFSIVNVVFLPEVVAPDLPALREISGLYYFFVVEPMFRQESQFRHKLHLDTAQRRHVEETIRRMQRELGERGCGHQLQARAAFIDLLVSIARAADAARSPDIGVDMEGKRHAVERAIAYIEENYASEVASLESISAQAFLSPHHLSEVFKKATGLSPWEYLIRIRLEQAKHLLHATDRKVTDIALTVGFGDPSHFARIFRLREGVTPQQFRAKGATTGRSS